MKTAQELLNELNSQREAEYNNLRELVVKKVGDFIEGWSLQNGTYQIFTVEAAKEIFGDFVIASKILREQGFEVEYIPGEESGHLWWKKRTQEMWKIKLPTKK